MALDTGIYFYRISAKGENREYAKPREMMLIK